MLLSFETQFYNNNPYQPAQGAESLLSRGDPVPKYGWPTIFTWSLNPRHWQCKIQANEANQKDKENFKIHGNRLLSIWKPGENWWCRAAGSPKWAIYGFFTNALKHIYREYLFTSKNIQLLKRWTIFYKYDITLDLYYFGIPAIVLNTDWFSKDCKLSLRWYYYYYTYTKIDQIE